MATHPTVPMSADGGLDNSIPLPPAPLRELLEALRSIRYGTVELVIHDGRVVQLERREKVRFEHGVTEYRRG
jgi:hypothetical protein